MDFRAPLAKVRGLGSAREGTEHFIAQRLTAVALIPLYLWFVFSIVFLSRSDYATVISWIKHPFVTVMLIALLLATFYHAQLGVRVIVEDYIKSEFMKVTLLVLTKFFAFILGVASIVAVLRIALGG